MEGRGGSGRAARRGMLTAANVVARAGGLSAGGFMAVQYSFAYSKDISGAAIFAGGPFYCAQDTLSTAVTSVRAAGPWRCPGLTATDAGGFGG